MIALAVAGLLAMQNPFPLARDGGADPVLSLGEIRMHLFYAETGRLSPDISPPREFAAWNTVSGGGQAEEPADDLAVVVEVRANMQTYSRTPLVITAHDGQGRLLGRRSFPDVATGENRRGYHMLYLQGVGCAGEIRVSATFRGQTRRETLTLNCGE